MPKIRKTPYKGSIDGHAFPTGAFLAVKALKNNFHLIHLANGQ